LIIYGVRNDKVTAQTLRGFGERITEDVSLQTFPENRRWRRRRDVQRLCCLHEQMWSAAHWRSGAEY